MNKTTKPDPLENLANEADTLAAEAAAPPLGEGVTDADVAARAEQEAEAEGMRQIEGAAVGVVLMGMKLGRRALAKQLPEVEQTLPDDKLRPSAEAFLPLIKKHIGRLMETAAKSPELAVALIGVLPIAMGVLEAMELHERNEAKRKAAPATAPLPVVEAA